MESDYKKNIFQINNMSDIFITLILGIIGAVVGGLVVLFIQNKVSKSKEKKRISEQKRLGKKKDTYIDKNFIFNYLPKFLSIEKVIADFGQPNKIFDDIVKFLYYDVTRNIRIYHYEFINAVVQFSTFENESSVVSVTTSSTLNSSYPIVIGSIFDGNEGICFGKARVNKKILNFKTKFEKHLFTNWGYSAVQAKLFYREIKGLTFTYVVCDLVDSEEEMLDKKIDQLCISINEDVYPIINYYDMKYR